MIVERLSLRQELQEQGGRFPMRRALEGVEGDGGVRDREAGREGGRVEYETPLRTKNDNSANQLRMYIDIQAFASERSEVEREQHTQK